MPESKRRDPPPRCELGVTGKRLRRALPTVSPPLAFRAALKEAICGQTDVDQPSPITPLIAHPERG